MHDDRSVHEVAVDVASGCSDLFHEKGEGRWWTCLDCLERALARERERVSALRLALEDTVNHRVDGKPCWCPTQPDSDARVIPHAACLDARTALENLPWKPSARGRKIQSAREILEQEAAELKASEEA